MTIIVISDNTVLPFLISKVINKFLRTTEQWSIFQLSSDQFYLLSKGYSNYRKHQVPRTWSLNIALIMFLNSITNISKINSSRNMTRERCIDRKSASWSNYFTTQFFQIFNKSFENRSILSSNYLKRKEEKN